MLPKAVAVGAVGKGDIEHLCVGDRLLQTKRNMVIVVFCLHNGNGLATIQPKNIVRLFRTLTRNKVASDIDPTVSDARFHRHLVLPMRKNRRRDVIQLYVFFGHLMSIENHSKTS